MKKSIKIISIFLTLSILFSSAAFAAATDTETPVTADEAELRWFLKLGTNYRNAPSVPAVHGDFVYTMSAKELHKISLDSGEILQTAEMSSTPSFGYTPPIVDGEIIFCPLEDGTVQAFDNKSLQPLWIYEDSLGGQALSPIVYDNGKIYTGFWNDEEAEANYVCLNAESGSIIWSMTRKGGFYWSEPAVSGDYLILGSDNGSGNSEDEGTVLSINKHTGEIIDSVEVIGDQRSGITYYNGYFYFVTKAGYLYKTSLSGDGKITSTDSAKLSGASTSTPTIYEDKIYIGVQSSGFSGSLCVFDAETLEPMQSIEMKGYPQNEILLTTAYNSVYIYSTYNAGPGGISVIKDGENIVSDLFIPEEGYRGYCISPVAAADDGTLIYKNDSGTLFAISKKITEEPEKSLFEIIVDWFKSIFNMIFALFK